MVIVKNIFSGPLFFEISNLENDTTYLHYNSLVTDKKTNSTIHYSWYCTGLHIDNEYNRA